jgi:hypothetical protein
MNKTDIPIFDAKGRLIAEPDAETLAQVKALSDADRILYDEIVSAGHENDRAEDVAKECRAAIGKLWNENVAAQAAVARLDRTGWTPHDEWLRNQRQSYKDRGLPVPEKFAARKQSEKDAARHREAVEAAAAAYEALTLAQAKAQAAEAALRPIRVRLSLAISKWRGAPKSVLENIRDFQRTANEERAAAARGERQPTPRAHASLLDAYRGSGRGAAGVSGAMGRRPGSYPAHALGRKLPSE